MQSSKYPNILLILIFFSQSCQILTGPSNFPAGTANTTFSVDSEDNVVITYGASKSHFDNTWRYFAALFSNQRVKGSKNNWFRTSKGIFLSRFFVPFFITCHES